MIYIDLNQRKTNGNVSKHMVKFPTKEEDSHALLLVIKCIYVEELGQHWLKLLCRNENYILTFDLCVLFMIRFICFCSFVVIHLHYFVAYTVEIFMC